MQTLNSDFHLLTGFSSNLFDWTGSKWYWRYHEKVRGVKWQPLSIALKAQFKDSKADRNLRSEIEQRKQRSIAALADKVTEQLSEQPWSKFSELNSFQTFNTKYCMSQQVQLVLNEKSLWKLYPSPNLTFLALFVGLC